MQVNNKHTNSKGKDYYLWSRTVELKGNRVQDVYFFTAHDFSTGSTPVDINRLDELNKEIIESPKTKLPFLKGKVTNIVKMNKVKKNLDKLHMMEERLREVCWELTMSHMIGWGPYLKDLKIEQEQLVKKIALWKKQNQ